MWNRSCAGTPVACNTSYCSTWTQPLKKTWRVNGRPGFTKPALFWSLRSTQVGGFGAAAASWLDTPLLPSALRHRAFFLGLLSPEGHFTGRRPSLLQFRSANTPPLLWYTSIVPTNLFWQQELWYAANNKSVKAITKNCQQTASMFPPRPRRGVFGVDLHASKEHLLPG